ncbi:oxidoreductase protein [Candidatus Micropelagos thuwalensis]|uniref:Oxidoreductase protein n=1 Tax=Candidatus Micropelagius thuwalensis TaxID=1397666 RepID=U2WU15_9PROT|nr:oxidoreductase protein [Candidatus Micropelagos thuwalensis]
MLKIFIIIALLFSTPIWANTKALICKSGTIKQNLKLDYENDVAKTATFNGEEFRCRTIEPFFYECLRSSNTDGFKVSLFINRTALTLRYTVASQKKDIKSSVENFNCEVLNLKL